MLGLYLFEDQVLSIGPKLDDLGSIEEYVDKMHSDFISGFDCGVDALTARGLLLKHIGRLNRFPKCYASKYLNRCNASLASLESHLTSIQ